MLVDLLRNTYEIGYIDKCFQCNRQGECTQKSEVMNLPPVLILHLKQFDSGA